MIMPLKIQMFFIIFNTDLLNLTSVKLYKPNKFDNCIVCICNYNGMTLLTLLAYKIVKSYILYKS